MAGSVSAWSEICTIPIRLQRNTLVMAAVVSAIAMFDSGPLPPEAGK